MAPTTPGDVGEFKTTKQTSCCVLFKAGAHKLWFRKQDRVTGDNRRVSSIFETAVRNFSRCCRGHPKRRRNVEMPYPSPSSVCHLLDEPTNFGLRGDEIVQHLPYPVLQCHHIRLAESLNNCFVSRAVKCTIDQHSHASEIQMKCVFQPTILPLNDIVTILIG